MMRTTSTPGVRAMDDEFALKFAEEWQAAWNSHDVDQILVHYTDDVVFQSPYIVQRLQEPAGEVHGNDELRNYWTTGLQQQTLVINCRNQHGHSSPKSSGSEASS